jgi:hypothetical protein
MEYGEREERRRELAQLSRYRRMIKSQYSSRSDYERAGDGKPHFVTGFGHGNKRAFHSGVRAGVWLAFNGPRAQAQRRVLDVGAMRRQDIALEGLGSVFERAEEQAQQAQQEPQRQVIRMSRPRGIVRPEVEAPPPAVEAEPLRQPLPQYAQSVWRMSKEETLALLRPYTKEELLSKYPNREDLRSIATRINVNHRDPRTGSINAESVARRIIERARE